MSTPSTHLPDASIFRRDFAVFLIQEQVAIFCLLTGESGHKRLYIAGFGRIKKAPASTGGWGSDGWLFFSPSGEIPHPFLPIPPNLGGGGEEKPCLIFLISRFRGCVSQPFKGCVSPFFSAALRSPALGPVFPCGGDFSLARRFPALFAEGGGGLVDFVHYLRSLVKPRRSGAGVVIKNTLSRSTPKACGSPGMACACRTPNY